MADRRKPVADVPAIPMTDGDTRWIGIFERKLNQKAPGWSEPGAIDKLRRDTLEVMQAVLDSAIEYGDRHYLLRVLRQSGRLAGLESPNVAIAIGGSSDSLPNLSAATDAELIEMARAAGISLGAARLDAPKNAEPVEEPEPEPVE